MNLVLLLTSENREGIEAFIASMEQLQEEEVNGALVMIYPSIMGRLEMEAMISSISPKFKKTSLLTVQANPSKPSHTQVAGMFSRFLLGAYSLFPGPWLVVDDKAEAKEANFMNKMLKQHRAGGGTMTGKSVSGKGWLVPIGPVVLEAPAKSLKFLHFITGESWRRKGQYHFARCGFVSLGPSEYSFNVAAREINPPSKSTPASAIRNVTPPEKAPAKPFVEPAPTFRPIPQGIQNENISAELNREFLMQGMEDDIAPVNIAGASNNPPHPITKMDDSELREYAGKILGKKPHHFTKRENVIKMISQATSPTTV